MPRKVKSADALLNEMRVSLEKLVEAARAEGRDEALDQVRGVLAGQSSPRSSRKPRSASKQRSRKALAKKATKKRKNPWANLTDEQRLARVNAIRKGKGLPPKQSLDS